MAKAAIVASLTVPPSADGKDLSAMADAVPWLEIRADLIGDLNTDWVRSFFPGRLLYSLRSRRAGGAFQGSETERASRLLNASRHYDLVELEGDSDLRPEILTEVPADKRMLSWYGHPADSRALTAQFDRLSSTQSRFYKLVVKGKRSKDAFGPLFLLKSLRRLDVIAFATGKTGFWARLVALQFGAPFIFGSAGRSWTDEGDSSVFQLIEDYGLPFLPPIDEIYGIVGNPIIHSLSPRMHNAAYRALRHPALFVPFQVESFSDFWTEVVTSAKLEMLGLPIKGLTVASPYKEAAMRKALVASPMSHRTGAANVFLRDNGHWKADTTDPEGITLAISSRGFSARGKKVAVIGCGGAGRPVAAALDQIGADVVLVNRGVERGQMAARILGLPFIQLSSFDARGFSILINATPVGRDDNEMPFDLAGLSDGALIVDLVYSSEPTPLAANATAMGHAVIDGQEILLIQVLHQFRKMTGRDMPIDIARKVIGRNGRPSNLRSEYFSMQALRSVIMDDSQVMMRADNEQVVSGEPDLVPLIGTWMNTNSKTDCISKLTIAKQSDKMVVRIYGANSPEPIDWGEVEAAPFVNGGSLEGVGFHARYDSGQTERFLAANHKLGILVIQSYTTFKDASGRMNYFAREFFHQ